MIDKLREWELRPYAALRPSLVHLFVFWAFAVAQPIYDIFGKYADFFVAHTARPLDVMFLVILVSFALPAMLGVAEWIAHLIHRRAQQAVHCVFVGALIVLTILPLLKKVSALSSIAVLAGGCVIGAVLLLLYLALPAVRQAVTYGVIATIIFPVYFVLFSPVQKIVFRHPPAQEQPQPSALNIDAPPIVFIIFDELPLVSLLDETHTIDKIRYPNFAQLAETAHWFRNFTTNGPTTVWSLPSIFTGEYTAEKRLLTAEANPRSLFTLLGPTYDIVPFGSLLLDLCPDKYVSSIYKPSSSLRIKSILRDISMVYLHIILPTNVSAGLPPVTDNWRDFAATGLKNAKDQEGLDNFTEKDPVLLFSSRPGTQVFRKAELPGRTASRSVGGIFRGWLRVWTT